MAIHRAAWMALAAFLILSGTYLMLLADNHVAASTPKAVVSGISQLAATTAQTVSAAKKPAGPADNGAVSACTPVVFSTPSQLNLDYAAEGLSIQNDAPVHYQIFGNTADILRTQIRDCGPGATGSADAEFTGQADYNLDWQYTTAQSNGTCSATDIKVGLHTALALPYWQPTAGATSGLAQRWQNFDAALLTHEQGHISIDKAYATKLITDLDNLGNMPCNQITDHANALMNADAALLDQANDSYDTVTRHGATQGAILPTR